MTDQSQNEAVNHSIPPDPGAPPKPLTAEESKQVLTEAISDSNELLICATTVLSLFPDTLAVDRTKVTVTKRSFVSTAEVVSIRIEDILSVTAHLGPFFGSIKVLGRVFNNETPCSIGRFWRGDAQRVKRILQGYVIAMQKKIDCSSLPTKELADMLDKLGEDAPLA